MAIVIRVNKPRPIRMRCTKPKPITVNVARSAGGRLPYYEGEYAVIPRVSEQTLGTANRSMREDVTVSGIPTWEVRNPRGTTFIIGEE